MKCFATSSTCASFMRDKEVAFMQDMLDVVCSTTDAKEFVEAFKNLLIQVEASSPRARMAILKHMDILTCHGKQLLQLLAQKTLRLISEVVFENHIASIQTGTPNALTIFDLHRDLVNDMLKGANTGNVPVHIAIEAVLQVARCYK